MMKVSRRRLFGLLAASTVIRALPPVRVRGMYLDDNPHGDFVQAFGVITSVTVVSSGSGWTDPRGHFGLRPKLTQIEARVEE